MNIKNPLVRNSLASGFGKLSTVFFRFVQVPLLLSALGTEDYGRWLILYSFPSWIMLANFGFGSVAANEVSMAVAAGNDEEARSIFATTLTLIAGIFVAGSILAIGVAPYVPWEVILRTSAEQHDRLARAVILLALSTLLSFFGEVYASRFRAARKAHISVTISSFHPWLELSGLLLVLQLSTRFDYLALAVLCSNVIYLVFVKWFSWRASPTLVFSRALVRSTHYSLLFSKGLAFQAFPIGNALLFQGNMLIVQIIIGPVGVALFGTVRTLVRSINQLLEMINQILWPELSLLFGAGDLQRAAHLHRVGIAAAVTLACLSSLFLALFGQTLYSFWTGSTIELPQRLLLLFLLPIPFNALWFTSSVIHVASNQYERLAMWYILAVTLSMAGCASLSHIFGIEGAAVSTLIGDLILIPYVLKTSMRLTNDTFEEFWTGIKKEACTINDIIVSRLST